MFYISKLKINQNQDATPQPPVVAGQRAQARVLTRVNVGGYEIMEPPADAERSTEEKVAIEPARTPDLNSTVVRSFYKMVKCHRMAIYNVAKMNGVFEAHLEEKEVKVFLTAVIPSAGHSLPEPRDSRCCFLIQFKGLKGRTYVPMLDFFVGRSVEKDYALAVSMELVLPQHRFVFKEVCQAVEKLLVEQLAGRAPAAAKAAVVEKKF